MPAVLANLGLWLVASLPVAIVVGRFIAAGDARHERPESKTRIQPDPAGARRFA